MFKTVKDVFETHDGNIVIFHRHGSYVSGYLPDRPKLELAHNYSRTWPDNLFSLDLNGIITSIRQGELLADWGIESLIWISDSARGIGTGIYNWQGFKNKGVLLPKPEFHPGASYPIYHFEGLEELLTKVGDPLPAQHLNGQHPGLWLENPQQFKDRIVKMINEAFATEKTVFIASHWENIILVYALWVDGKDLGQVSETWAPTKSGGIVLFKDNGVIKGLEYNPQFEIVQQ